MSPTKDQDALDRRHEEQEQWARRVENFLFAALNTREGRFAVAFMTMGGHSLAQVYTPGCKRTFDEVAFEAGRQYEARELIGILRRTERCRTLYDQAIREYEHERDRRSDG